MIKAACHIHSDWSYDGKWTLHDLAAEFSRREYQVLLITEHDRGFSEARRLEHRQACAEASSSKILLVPGIEYSDPENIVHILVWGNVPFLGENVSTATLLQRIRAAGGLAVMAHPSRKNAWQKFQSAWAPDLLGIEVWNRKTDGWAPSRTASQLLAGTSLSPFVGLDFHDRKQFFSLATLLNVNEALTEQAVLDCLRLRRFSSFAFDKQIEQMLSSKLELGLHAAEAARRTAAMAYRKARALAS